MIGGSGCIQSREDEAVENLCNGPVARPVPARLRSVFGADTREEAVRLEGRTALVTGAASGIGRAVAARFAAEGARVALLDKADAVALETVADEIALAGGRAVCLIADVSDAAAVDAAVARAAAEIGSIGIAVNAAAIWHPTPVMETDAVAQFDRMIDINLKGTFHVIRAVLPGMIEAGCGHIVTFASVAGVMGLSQSAAYAASKGGVILLTRSLGTELAGHGVHVNAIAPGNVRTPMNAWMREPGNEEMIRRFEQQNPSGRAFSEPDDIVNAVLFLCTSESAAFYGAVLVADEGLTASIPAL